MKRVFAAIALGLSLGACESLPWFGGQAADEPIAQPAPPAAPPPQAVCPAEQYQVLIGQPAAEIDVASLPQPARMYGEFDAVTMDYAADRLNIVVSVEGRVIEVKCG